MSDSPTASRFHLKIAGWPRRLTVVSFHGREAVSEPFVFHLEVRCEGPAPKAASLMYRMAFLTLDDESAEGPPGFHGQVHAVARAHYRPGPACYRLSLGPRLACLAQRYTPRVFQHMNAVQIISRVLGEHGIQGDSYRFHLKAACAERRFCAQYRENDLQFVQRLCAEEGIHYHFVHSPRGHALVFASGLHGVRRSPPARCCQPPGQAGVSRFTVCHTGPLRQNSRSGQRGEGHSNLPFVGCGQLLPLSGHPRTEWNHLWRVVHVEHQGGAGYRNRFVAWPWEVSIKPSPVPVIPLPDRQRGRIVGRAGHAVEADAAGRVCVQLDWARQGHGARFSRCWLPVQGDVQGPLHGGMPVLVGQPPAPGLEPSVIANLATASQPPAMAGGSLGVQAGFAAAWLLGESGVVSLPDGPQLHLATGARLHIQAGASQVRLADGQLLLSSPGLTFSASRPEPAIVVAQPPGDMAQGQATHQGEEHEGQP